MNTFKNVLKDYISYPREVWENQRSEAELEESAAMMRNLFFLLFDKWHIKDFELVLDSNNHLYGIWTYDGYVPLTPSGKEAFDSGLITLWEMLAAFEKNLGPDVLSSVRDMDDLYSAIEELLEID